MYNIDQILNNKSCFQQYFMFFVHGFQLFIYTLKISAPALNCTYKSSPQRREMNIVECLFFWLKVCM